MGCVVEDLKVSQDDLFETIEGLGDEVVQSVDVVSFQKVWLNSQFYVFANI